MKLLLSIFALFLSTNTNAELIDNGKYTTDTETGLDWLDLTETKGLSYEFVSSHFGSGGQFEGWSFATREQINVFLSHAGFVKELKTNANKESVSGLINL